MSATPRRSNPAHRSTLARRSSPESDPSRAPSLRRGLAAVSGLSLAVGGVIAAPGAAWASPHTSPGQAVSGWAGQIHGATAGTPDTGHATDAEAPSEEPSGGTGDTAETDAAAQWTEPGTELHLATGHLPLPNGNNLVHWLGASAERGEAYAVQTGNSAVAAVPTLGWPETPARNPQFIVIDTAQHRITQTVELRLPRTAQLLSAAYAPATRTLALSQANGRSVVTVALTDTGHADPQTTTLDWTPFLVEIDPQTGTVFALDSGSSFFYRVDRAGDGYGEPQKVDFAAAGENSVLVASHVSPDGTLRIASHRAGRTVTFDYASRPATGQPGFVGEPGSFDRTPSPARPAFWSDRTGRGYFVRPAADGGDRELVEYAGGRELRTVAVPATARLAHSAETGVIAFYADGAVSTLDPSAERFAFTPTSANLTAPGEACAQPRDGIVVPDGGLLWQCDRKAGVDAPVIEANSRLVTPGFAMQPQAVSVAADPGATATFTVEPSGTPAPSVRWQRLDGTEWRDLTDGDVFSGTATAQLTVRVSEDLTGASFRAVASATAERWDGTPVNVGRAASQPATLTVTAPSPQQPEPVADTAGEQTTDTAAPAAGAPDASADSDASSTTAGAGGAAAAEARAGSPERVAPASPAPKSQKALELARTGGEASWLLWAAGSLVGAAALILGRLVALRRRN